MPMPSPSPLPQTRTSSVLIRLTPDERATLDREASAAGLSVSEFARRRMLSGRSSRQKPTARAAMAPAAAPAYVAMSPPLFAELSRIGNNLNQLARAFNRGQDFNRGEVMRLTAQAWQTMLRDEVTARYLATAEAKLRGPR